MVTGVTEASALDCTCKVGRVARRRDVPDVHAELYRRWVDDDDSLRDLARWFDRRVLESALQTAGDDPGKRDVRRLYETLRERQSSGPLPAVLTREAVDVDEVRADFVSHQTIHRHLRECLQADQARSDASLTALRAYRNRTTAAAERALSVAVGSDREFEVSVTVEATCGRCGRSLPVVDLVDHDGCECSDG